MCFNRVEKNNAIQGAGVAIEFEKSAFCSFCTDNQFIIPSAHLEHNRIRKNRQWAHPTNAAFLYPNPGYAGGGVFVVNDDDGLQEDTGGELRLYNNTIHENTMVLASPGVGTAIPAGRGGGVYLDLNIGPIWGTDPVDPEAGGHVEVTGNAIFHNAANDQGGGLFYSVRSFGLLESVGEILNATISHNRLERMGFASPEMGTGLFLASESSFISFNNIIFYNEASSDNSWEWVWESPVDTGSSMGFSQMLRMEELNTEALSSNTDLFSSGPNNDNSSGCVVEKHLPNTSANSPCMDSAAPGLTLPISLDVQEDPRVWGVRMNRGADEIPLGGLFIRGDSNQDGRVNGADPIHLLFHLSNGGPMPVADAGDVNDDGTLDIADVIYLLASLYQGGPKPPEPYFVLWAGTETCQLNAIGQDPTPDTLVNPGPFFCQ